MISITGVTKRFGRLHVLQGVNIEVRRGRITAVIGPNGAGKTTLIKSILGLARPDGGEIVLDGYRVNGDPRYRARIGYMPQLPRFPENLTGRELLDMVADLRGPATVRDDRLARRFRLDSELDKPLRTLSGGNRQKVNAVLAFLFDPDVLILDEPTAGLDPVASRVLKDQILADRDAGKTFVITSHVLAELEELADDVAFLVDGRVAFFGSLAELLVQTGQPTLERAIAHLMESGAR